MNGENTGVPLSPSRAKQLIDDVYALAQATKQIDAEQAENTRTMLLEKSNQELALQEHIQKLKSGEAKIGSVSDASYYYSAQRLSPIISSPLLERDNQFYSGEVIVDFQDKQNLLRAKIENYCEMRNPPNLVPLAYVFLRTNSKTVSFNPKSLRIGQHVQVVGKYVDNIQYTTISGETKISPVIQVIYMGSQ